MFFSENEPDLNVELEKSTVETIEAIVGQLMVKQRAKAKALEDASDGDINAKTLTVVNAITNSARDANHEHNLTANKFNATSAPKYRPQTQPSSAANRRDSSSVSIIQSNNGPQTISIKEMPKQQVTTIQSQAPVHQSPLMTAHYPKYLQTGLSEPQRALHSTIGVGQDAAQKALKELENKAKILEYGPDFGWKQNQLDVKKETVSSQMAALNEATAQVITLTSVPKEELDHPALGAAIHTISTNLPEMSRDVKVIAALMDDDDKGEKLIDAARNLCSAFSELLKAAEPAIKTSRQSLLNAASKVGEATTNLLYTIGEEYEYDREAADMLLSLSKPVANAAAKLVLKAKDVASRCDDQSAQNRVISSATQCALATSQLVASAKVVAPTIRNPNCQRQIIESSKEVAKFVDNIVNVCQDSCHDPRLIGDLKGAAADVTQALNNLLNHVRSLSDSRGRRPTDQHDGAVDTILDATDRLFSSMGDATEMVRQAKILAQATAQLIHNIKGQAETQPDSDLQTRLLSAAKVLADATSRLVDAAKGCATNPHNSDSQAALKRAAEDLRNATNSAASSALKRKVICRLESSAKHATAMATQNIAAAHGCGPYNTNDTIQDELIQVCRQVSDIIPKVVQGIRGTQTEPKSTKQLQLINACDLFISPAQRLVFTSKSVIPTVTDQLSTIQMTQSSQQLAEALIELQLNLGKAQDACSSSMEFDAAIDSIRELDKELAECRKAAINYHLKPLTGENLEYCSSQLNTTCKSVGSSMAQLLTAASQGNENFTGHAGRDVSKSLKNLTSAVRGGAATSTERDVQMRVIDIARDVLEKSIVLFEETKWALHNPHDRERQQRLTKVAKSVSNSLNNCLPGQRDVEESIRNITDATQLIGKELLVFHKSYSELQTNLTIAATKLNESVFDVIDGSRSPTLLANCSTQFSLAFSQLFDCGLEIAGQSKNYENRSQMLNSLKTLSMSSSKLLVSAKSVSVDPNAPNTRSQLASSARSVTESINNLVNVCSSSAPGQKECDSAIRNIQMMRSLLDNPSEPINDSTYFECLETVTEKSRRLGDAMTGIANHEKRNEHKDFGYSVKEASDSICGLLEGTAQSAYLVGSSDPSSVAGRAGLVDINAFHKANEAIQSACNQLCSQSSNKNEILSAAPVIAKHTSALCNSCQVASPKTSNPVAKRHFVQLAKDVANATASLIKENKTLDQDPDSDYNHTNCAEAKIPLLDAVENLTVFASSPDFAPIPAKISHKARSAQEPITLYGLSIIDASCNMIIAAKTLALNPKDPPGWQTLANHSKNVSDSIKKLVTSIKDASPGQRECNEAVDKLNICIRELDHVTTSNVEVANRIKGSVQKLGTACIDITKSAGQCQANPSDNYSQRELTDNAEVVTENVSYVLAAPQAGSRGTQACINAASTVSSTVGDLNTTIMFAASGTYNAENENGTFTDHREAILKTAKALVEDTKTLVAGAASSQEQLAVAMTGVIKGGRYKVVNDVSNQIFCIRKAKLNVEGKYTITDYNTHGKDSCNIEVNDRDIDYRITELDKPGAPEGPLNIDSVDKDRVDLSWRAPKDDGGSEITGYDVKRKDLKSNRWLKVNRDAAKRLKFTDDSVTDGHLYEYRVDAQNAAGVSEPSFTCKPIVAKPLKEKPKLHLVRLNGKTIRVRAGDPLVINRPMTGAPQPEVKWIINDEPLKPSNRIETQNKNEMISLKIPVLQRSNSGKYTIKATNPYGEDTADIQVLVYNIPSPPRGPLEYQSVTNSTATLSWKTPEDDGGAEIIAYSVEKCEIASDKWIPAGSCSGTSLTAKNLEEGKQYKFKVMAENMYGISEPLDGRPVTAKNPFDTPDSPGQPTVEDYGPTFAAIKWTPPLSDGGRPIQGYLIEKREKGFPDWIGVNSVPTLHTDFTIPNQTEGKSYEFRVIAVNEGGKGKPSKPLATMTAKERKFPPDAPDMPRVEKITKTGVTLSWKKPLNDGGSRITGYIVEKKPKGDKDWEVVTKFPVSDTTYAVPNLIEGNEYEFRIIAVNDVGDSPPSRACPLVKADNQPNKPKIDVGSVRDITVKAGQDFSINVLFTANPKPTANWSVNNNDIDSVDTRFMQKTSDDYTQLVCTNSTREYTGKYSLLLKNSCGFDTVTCNVRVLDRPSPPQNVRGEDVEGESLKLKWAPPKDDGSSKVTNYVVERREVGTNSWTRVSSFANGTALRVRNLTVGRRYDFRVMAGNQYGTSDPARTDESILAKLPFDTPYAPGTPRAIDTSEDSITLTWTKPRNDGGSPITGYVLEKRKVGDKDWSRPSPATIADLTYRMPGLKNNEEYEFRVAAINAAGTGPFSYASDAIIARRAPTAPRIDADFAFKDITVMAGEQFSLRVPFSGSPAPKAEWTVNGKTVIPDDRITAEVNVAFIILLNKKARREDSGKYGLKLTNTEGSDTAFCRVSVVDVPEAPQGPLDVSDITPEMCSLAWRPPLNLTENNEYDFKVSAVNSAGKSEPCLMSTLVKVQEIAGGSKPEFVRKLLNKNTNLKSQITLECEAIGKPLPTSRWLRNGQELHASGRVKAVDTDEGVYKLIFTEVWYTDEADYTCEAVNLLGSDKTSCTIRLAAPPQIIRCPNEVFFSEKDNGKIKIFFSGSAPFDVTLFKDGFEVKESDHLKYTVFDKYIIIFIRDVMKSDEAKYKVIVKNESGQADASLAVFVTGLPGRPTGPLEITNIYAKGCELHWEKPDDDGGRPIHGYVIEKLNTLTDNWAFCGRTGKDNTRFNVIELTEGKLYQFRVKALNSDGESEPLVTTEPILAKNPYETELTDEHDLVDLTLSPTGTTKENSDSDSDSIRINEICIACDEEFGSFIVCDKCLQSFHLKCHIPEIKVMPDIVFICTFCREAPKLTKVGRPRKSGFNKRQQFMAEKVVFALICHKPSKQVKYDFRSIKNILFAIKDKLIKRIYESEIELIEDIAVMIGNQRQRATNTQDTNDLIEFERHFYKQINLFLPDFVYTLSKPH